MNNLTTLIKRYAAYFLGELSQTSAGNKMAKANVLNLIFLLSFQEIMPVILSPELSLTILKRLEAATSRLEDMVPDMDQSAATNGLSASDEGIPTPGSSKQIGASDAPRSPAPLPPAIDDFDSVINGDVTKFVTMSEHIGGLVAEQVSQC